ncbi:hypothetical protein [Aquimarina addita]
MKKIMCILFMVSCSTVICQETDSLEIIEIPASYADRTGEPFTVKRDSLYIFRTPDVFLVNKKSFLAIKNVYQTTIQQDKMTKELVEKYSQTLRRNIDLERSLKINFTKSDSLDQIVYNRTQAVLGNTQRALDYTLHSLEKATNSLELIENTSKRERRKTILEKVLIGIAGFGAGVIVGISL